jgi:GNAT superfamily N-acetyltransferase
MYVRPAARRGGVAALLLDALEAEARAAGFTALRLETGELQTEAIAFYARRGYTEIDCFGEYEGVALSRCFERLL